MKEHWVVEAEQNAKDLAEILYEQITDEADDICVDRKWYFEKVVQYMRTGSEDQTEGMNVLINIPDHLYKLLKDLPSDSNEGTIENVLMKAVENGIPLEKIRAEQKALITTNSTSDYSNGVMNCLNVIDKYKGDKE